MVLPTVSSSSSFRVRIVKLILRAPRRQYTLSNVKKKNTKYVIFIGNNEWKRLNNIHVVEHHR